MTDESQSIPSKSSERTESAIPEESSDKKRQSQDKIPFLKLIEKVSEQSDPLRKLIREISDRYLEVKTTRIKFNFKTTLVAAVFVVVVIGIMAWLTYVGRIPGATFTFMMGLIIGYMLTFFQNVSGITSPEE